MQPQLVEGGPSHHNTVRQQSVDWPNRVEDRNRSAQLTEGNNRDTSPVNPDGSVGSTNYTQMVGLGGGAPGGPSFGLNAPLQQGRFNQSGDIDFDNSLSTSTGGLFPSNGVSDIRYIGQRGRNARSSKCTYSLKS